MTADDVKAFLTCYYNIHDPTEGIPATEAVSACVTDMRRIICEHCGKTPPLSWRQWQILALVFCLHFSQEVIAMDYIGSHVSTVHRDFRDALESIAKRWN